MQLVYVHGSLFCLLKRVCLCSSVRIDLYGIFSSIYWCTVKMSYYFCVSFGISIIRFVKLIRTGVSFLNGFVGGGGGVI